MQRPERDGWFLEPTVRPRRRCPTEEIFGPVVTVEPFDSEDEAVQRANDSEFGLGRERVDARSPQGAIASRGASRRGWSG